jgi:hypothetical protein
LTTVKALFTAVRLSFTTVDLPLTTVGIQPQAPCSVTDRIILRPPWTTAFVTSSGEQRGISAATLVEL